MRELLPYGYKSYNGKVLADPAIDAYNMIQDEINRWHDAGIAVKEELLNRSHKLFVDISRIY